MKYKVYAVSKSVYAYEVEAKSKAEAEEKFWDGEWEGCEDCPSYNIDSDERVLEVKKV